MSRKHDKTGRSRHGPPFVRLFRYMLDGPAWRSLSVYARAALIELGRVYYGSNNGQLAMSVRVLADRLGSSKDSAAKALKELEETGFVATTKVGSYKRKDRRASEYRLTMFRCDESFHPPSNDFLRWQGLSQSAHKDRTVRSRGRAKENCRSQSEQKDRDAKEVKKDSPMSGTHIESTMGGGDN
jgi:DNA-binding Lrp family transcriptional regulator